MVIGQLLDSGLIDNYSCITLGVVADVTQDGKIMTNDFYLLKKR